MPRLVIPDYTVVRDTREQDGHGWVFEPNPGKNRPPRCLGTVAGTLKTGDYSAKGYEDLLVVERKADFCELWTNYQDRERFEAEIERMTDHKYRYLIVESILTPEVMALSPPQFKTGVPGKALTGWLLLLSVRHGVHIIPAGSQGKRIARQIIENVVWVEKDRWQPQR